MVPSHFFFAVECYSKWIKLNRSIMCVVFLPLWFIFISSSFTFCFIELSIFKQNTKQKRCYINYVISSLNSMLNTHTRTHSHRLIQNCVKLYSYYPKSIDMIISFDMRMRMHWIKPFRKAVLKWQIFLQTNRYIHINTFINRNIYVYRSRIHQMYHEKTVIVHICLCRCIKQNT